MGRTDHHLQPRGSLSESALIRTDDALCVPKNRTIIGNNQGHAIDFLFFFFFSDDPHGL